MDARFDQLAEEAAAGLKDDQELCRDVRKELAAHLEDAACELQAEGHDAEESAAGAMKAFGSPLEVAADLLEANRRRLRLRALARLAARALLIPLALAVALWCVLGRALHALEMSGFMQQTLKRNTAIETNHSPIKSVSLHPHMNRAEIAAFLRATDGHHQDGMRKLWKAHRNDPDGKIYYGYSTLMEDPDLNDSRKFAPFEHDMRQGERFDPDNAIYNYRLALAFLDKGMICRDEMPTDRTFAS